MAKAFRELNFKFTPQTEQASAKQKQNNAGGYSFTISNMDRLKRFLILGTDGGTYYVSQRDLTKQNVDFVRGFLAEDAKTVLDVTVEVSTEGRAKSNSAALFVVALAMNTEGVDRSLAKNALLKVARTSTHLFEYADYLQILGGWGRAKKESIANWYQSKNDSQLATQLVKYRQRNGRTHRDLFRQSHPTGLNSDIVNFALGKPHNSTEKVIVGFEKAKTAGNVKEIVNLIENYGLMWEAIPTEFLNEIDVWKTLFYSGNLGQTALLRNVTRIARMNGFNDMKFAADYANALSDAEKIARGRVHPISYLLANLTYTEGQMIRNGAWNTNRNRNWTVDTKIATALDSGFYNAFKSVEPAEKRTLVALDVSGSMGQPANGIDLTCAEVGAAFAMQIARTEPYSMIRGFSDNFIDLGITENMTFSQALAATDRWNFGGTDCALPMKWALDNEVEIDTFVVVTDNETWAGNQHPHQALKKYRNTMGINAKLVVMGVSANYFTVADSNDGGMLDVVGFDSAASKLVADFSAGRI